MTGRHYYKSTVPWTDNVLNIGALNKRREKIGGILERETDDSRSFSGWTNILSFPCRLSVIQEADLCVEYYQHP